MVHLRRCCCCIHLQTGTIVIALLNMIGSLVLIGKSSIDLPYSHYFEYGMSQPATFGELIFVLLFGIIGGLCGIYLLLGGIQGNVSKMQPWMTVHTLLVIVLAVCVGYAMSVGFCARSKGSSDWFIGVTALMISLLLEVHFVLVVYSSCQTLREIPPTSKQGG